MRKHSRPGVMHVVDSLDVGGTETVAVNLANRLPRDRFRSYLCSTRPSPDRNLLTSSIGHNVRHLGLNRKGTFDIGAILRFHKFLGEEDIRLLHVHGSSLFFGQLASILRPFSRVRVVWHDHYGRCELDARPKGLYRLAIKGAAGVIAVNHRLADWACRELHVSPRRVWYVPNFVVPSDVKARVAQSLPGRAGSRIVCVANLRPQKDHLTLIRAMAQVCEEHPEAHLLLVGLEGDKQYAESLRAEVSSLKLENNITFLGQVEGVPSVLSACDIGVLSSASEGLPLSLLEYGSAGLASIATSVGQCPEVLDYGRAGILVQQGASGRLAAAIQLLLDSPKHRAAYGQRFREHVRSKFDPAAIIGQICDIYDFVLSEN